MPGSNACAQCRVTGGVHWDGEMRTHRIHFPHPRPAARCGAVAAHRQRTATGCLYRSLALTACRLCAVSIESMRIADGEIRYPNPFVFPVSRHVYRVRFMITLSFLCHSVFGLCV